MISYQSLLLSTIVLNDITFYPTEAIHQWILLYCVSVIALGITKILYGKLRCLIKITHQQFSLEVKAFLKSLVEYLCY